MGGRHIPIAQIIKADFTADQRAAAVVAKHVKAAAGAHADDGSFAFRKGSERFNTGIKVRHQCIHLTFQAEHGSDCGSIFAHTFHNADFRVRG